MNKTVNINLGGMIFHIDENAYLKLQSDLSAVKRSFAGASGEDEIIADIEARIAELFSNKMQNERQVIGINEVDEIINIMGQPEDYMVDEDIFDEVPKSKSYSNNKRKLYRDTDNKYVGGVSSGLGPSAGLYGAIFIAFFASLFGISLYIVLKQYEKESQFVKIYINSGSKFCSLSIAPNRLGPYDVIPRSLIVKSK